MCYWADWFSNFWIDILRVKKTRIEQKRELIEIEDGKVKVKIEN